MHPLSLFFSLLLFLTLLGCILCIRHQQKNKLCFLNIWTDWFQRAFETGMRATGFRYLISNALPNTSEISCVARSSGRIQLVRTSSLELVANLFSVQQTGWGLTPPIPQPLLTSSGLSLTGGLPELTRATLHHDEGKGAGAGRLTHSLSLCLPHSAFSASEPWDYRHGPPATTLEPPQEVWAGLTVLVGFRSSPTPSFLWVTSSWIRPPGVKSNRFWKVLENR